MNKGAQKKRTETVSKRSLNGRTIFSKSVGRVSQLFLRSPSFEFPSPPFPLRLFLPFLPPPPPKKKKKNQKKNTLGTVHTERRTDGSTAVAPGNFEVYLGLIIVALLAKIVKKKKLQTALKARNEK